MEPLRRKHRTPREDMPMPGVFLKDAPLLIPMRRLRGLRRTGAIRHGLFGKFSESGNFYHYIN